jgi:plasmid maintenance system killer protein
VVGRRYVDRIDTIADTVLVNDLYEIRSWDFHPLRAYRAGQHAIRLTGQMRLIVTLQGERAMTIEEVTDYHG